jgi:RHS repeat-associated protein
MKKYLYLMVLLVLSFSIKAQTIPATIVKENYTVTGNVTLVASQSIILKPNTVIQYGSTFTAKVDANGYNPGTYSDQNFVFTRVYQKAVKNDSELTKNKDVIENIAYFDGLGRPMQNISIKASPSNQDIITPIGYDSFGRQEKDYLPYMEKTGAIASYRSGAVVNANNYYITNYPADITASTPNPYSQKQFEASPLNRVLQQAATGNDWSLANNHTIKMDYQTNSDLDAVKLYTVTAVLDGTGVYNPTIANTTNFVAGQLYKTITKDENWILADGKNKTTEEFKDKEGHVVLKRTYSNYTDTQGNITATEAPHDTYYVYDQYSNLTYVLPPKADGLTDITTLNNLCYQYKYDYRNRLVEKKLPGKEWEYIVYDKLDRPILTQDANLKTLNKWMFTKYDAFNRPVYTGEYINTVSTTRAAVQADANAVSTLSETKQGINTIKGSTVYYSNNAFPSTGIDLYTINYYDDYNFDLNDGVTETAYDITPITNVKGLATGSKIRILGQTTWTTNVIYYDAKGKPIYNYSKNDFLATTDKVKSLLDFAGKIQETTSTHTRAAVTTTIINTYEYDHVGRLSSQKQKVNTQPEEVIVTNTYDDLGQLISKGVGGKTTQNRLQTVDYAYNIRGWLKNINNTDVLGNDLFAFKVNYNNVIPGVSPLFNGNISQTQWKTASVNTTGNPLSNSYAYTYDALNRLTSGIDNTTNYNESLSYDKNGNIMNILRKGNTDTNATIFGTMDNLVYTYDAGNQLTKVEDSSGSSEGFNNGSIKAIEYTYDNNGNLLRDYNKNITSNIAYNYLNLPNSIRFNGEAAAHGRTWSANIDYTYDATGNKLSKRVTKTEYSSEKGGFVTTLDITTDYARGFIYENKVMKFFSQPEGYVANNAGAFSYIYQYKDHLGSIRLSFGDGNNDGIVNNADIVEENNYYPFGLKHKGYNSVVTSTNPGQKYKYNGKEFQDELGLNFYDYGARNYDPALGRWMNIDPLVEKFPSWSPYAYCENNPINMVDPTGLTSESVNSPIYDSKTGKYLGVDSQGFLRGNVLFMDSDKYNELSNNGKNRIDHNKAVKNSTSISQLPNNEQGMNLFYKAVNHIAKTMDNWFYNHDPKENLLGGDIKVFSNQLGIGTPGINDKGYSLDTIGQNDSGAWDSSHPEERIDRVSMNFDYKNLMNTAPNIFSLFEHEFYGHGLNGWRNKIGGNEDPHKKVYNFQVNTFNFIHYSTGEYKEMTLRKNKSHGN